MNIDEKEPYLNRLKKLISKSDKAKTISNFMENEFDELLAFILALEYNINKLPHDVININKSLIDKLIDKIITIKFIDLLIRSSGLIDLRDEILNHLIFNNSKMTKNQNNKEP